MVRTKRELLLFICEHPGMPWEGAPNGFQQTYAWLEELTVEGWITEMLGGFEATAKGLDEHPLFPSQEDIADTAQEAEQGEAEKLLERLRSRPSTEVTERVAMLLLILLSRHLTLNAAYAVVVDASQAELRRDSAEGRLVLEWADLLLG